MAGGEETWRRRSGTSAPGPGRNPRRNGCRRSRTAQVRVRALYGAISRGTEALVSAGRVPESEYQRMRAPLHGRQLPVPGEIRLCDRRRGRGRAGRRWSAALSSRCIRIRPSSTCRPMRSCRCPTACRRARRARRQHGDRAQRHLGRGAGPGRTASRWSAPAWSARWSRFSARGLPGAEVTLVDIDPARAELAARARRWLSPRPTRRRADCDLVFHASGSAAGLRTALGLAGDEATIIEMSWYGAGDVAVPLGGAFHSRRLKLISSQVGKVAPSHRRALTHRAAARSRARAPRRSAARRAACAGHSVPRSSGAASRYPEPRSGVLCQLISYS